MPIILNNYAFDVYVGGFKNKETRHMKHLNKLKYVHYVSELKRYLNLVNTSEGKIPLTAEKANTVTIKRFFKFVSSGHRTFLQKWFDNVSEKSGFVNKDNDCGLTVYDRKTVIIGIKDRGDKDTKLNNLMKAYRLDAAFPVSYSIGQFESTESGLMSETVELKVEKIVDISKFIKWGHLPCIDNVESGMAEFHLFMPLSSYCGSQCNYPKI